MSDNDDQNLEEEQEDAADTMPADGPSDETEASDDSESAESGVDLQEWQKDSSDPDDPDDAMNQAARNAQDLEPVFDVTVNVQAVLGRSNLEVSQLLKLGPGAVIELDRKVGEAIDIYVNNRLVARGEVVLVDNHLGVTMTEIIKGDRI